MANPFYQMLTTENFYFLYTLSFFLWPVYFVSGLCSSTKYFQDFSILWSIRTLFHFWVVFYCIAFFSCGSMQNKVDKKHSSTSNLCKDIFISLSDLKVKWLVCHLSMYCPSAPSLSFISISAIMPWDPEKDFVLCQLAPS